MARAAVAAQHRTRSCYVTRAADAANCASLKHDWVCQRAKDRARESWCPERATDMHQGQTRKSTYAVR